MPPHDQRLLKPSCDVDQFAVLGAFDSAANSIELQTSDTTPQLSIFQPAGFAAIAITVDPGGLNGGPFGPYTSDGTDHLGNPTFDVTDNLPLGPLAVDVSGTDADGQPATGSGRIEIIASGVVLLIGSTTSLMTSANTELLIGST